MADGLKALDLGDLGLDRGGALLVARALRRLAPGDVLEVAGRAPELAVHLRGWCRAEGHGFEPSTTLAGGRAGGRVTRGDADLARWRGAARAGGVAAPGGVADRADARWGLAARGALVEAGAPALEGVITDKDLVWTDDAPRLYAQAAAAQWDPATAIDWSAPVAHDDEVEDAVVQLMTYLVENEHAALLVPARVLGRVHPHFREVLQVLAIQAADEARHVEVFTRRARLRRDALGTSSAGGQASLLTLLAEPDWALAAFLLSVLGEGSFLSLLSFIERHAPDPITASVCRLAALDEARHVAFGLSHLRRHVERDPALRPRLAAAIEGRHAALRDTAGLNASVFDALLVLAAPGPDRFAPASIAAGWDRVLALQADMDTGRRHRLRMLGFPDGEAARLSSLHTRNFM